MCCWYSFESSRGSWYKSAVVLQAQNVPPPYYPTLNLFHPVLFCGKTIFKSSAQFVKASGAVKAKQFPLHAIMLRYTDFISFFVLFSTIVGRVRHAKLDIRKIPHRLVSFTGISLTIGIMFCMESETRVTLIPSHPRIRRPGF